MLENISPCNVQIRFAAVFLAGTIAPLAIRQGCGCGKRPHRADAFRLFVGAPRPFDPLHEHQARTKKGQGISLTLVTRLVPEKGVARLSLAPRAVRCGVPQGVYCFREWGGLCDNKQAPAM